ncbi:Hypothetical predicted protein [Paramuricea clavata]|uniref:Uncharacterized protein n=1 Tax=Paramuricea clavata TaxID=317549 RepID=A0A7D9JPU0_PARCT|nr:Hypothetical predicted protein [Paramuricea clavata]
MGELKAVKYSEGMEKELLVENKLLRKDLRNLVGYITPYIPLIGILSAGIIVGKHVVIAKENVTFKYQSQKLRNHIALAQPAADDRHLPSFPHAPGYPIWNTIPKDP